MKRRNATLFACIISIVCLMISLSGCNTKSTKAYTFNVDNGDKIKITLDTTGEYDLASNLPFAVSMNGTTQSQGTFIEADSYQQYLDVVNSDAKAELIDQGERDDVKYIFWCYNSSEYNYAVLINDSKTGVIIGNIVSEESAKECFDRLKFSCET